MTRTILRSLGTRVRQLLPGSASPTATGEGRVSLRRRAFTPAATALLAIGTAGVASSWVLQRMDAIHALQDEVRSVARALASGIDGAQHREWGAALEEADSERAGAHALKRLEGTLADLAELEGLVATTLHLRSQARESLIAKPDARRDGSFVRVASGTTRTPGRVEYVPAMESALLGGEVSASAVSASPDGRAVFAWAPLADGFGEVTGLLEVRSPAESALAAVARAHGIAALVLWVGFGGALCLGLRRVTRAARALEGLAGTARDGVVEEPYLAGDEAAELLALTEALETRREQEVSTRMRLTADVAEARAQREEATRSLQARERLLRELRHRFVGPLRGLAGAVGRVRAEDVRPEERADLRGAVLESCSLATYLDGLGELDDLREHKRVPELAALDVLALVQDLKEHVTPFAQENGADLRVVVGAGIPASLPADAALFGGALEAFTKNAVRAVGRAGGGTVSLRVHRLEGETTSTLRFELCDSAPGLSDAELDALFEPLPRGSVPPRRSGALDLSWALARERVLAHGAAFAIESDPNAGTRLAFTLTLAGSGQGHPVEAPLGALPGVAPAEAAHVLR